MISLLLTVSFFMGVNDPVIFIKEYPVDLPEDEALIDPHFFDFSPDGELYLVERLNPRIHRWSKEGKYLGNFSKEGQGPGELQSPQLIYVTDDEVWVYDRPTALFSVFTREGKFQKTVPYMVGRVRRFAVVNDQYILAGYLFRDKNPRDEFHLLDHEGNSVKLLKSIKNEMFLTPAEGDDSFHIKAYGPELDIFSDKKGSFWFGFSQEKTIYKMNNQGQIVDKINLDFRTTEPTDPEKEAIKRMRFTGDRGEVFSLKYMKNLKMHYDYKKAYYTHFMITGNKAVAVLTPISGTDMQKGYNEGSYTVMEFKDRGKPLAAGSYRFPEDVQLWYNNGRMVGAFFDENDAFVIKEFTFRGL